MIWLHSRQILSEKRKVKVWMGFMSTAGPARLSGCVCWTTQCGEALQDSQFSFLNRSWMLWVGQFPKFDKHFFMEFLKIISWKIEAVNGWGAVAVALHKNALPNNMDRYSKAMKHTNGKLGVEFLSLLSSVVFVFIWCKHLHFLQVWVSNNLRELKQNIWLFCLLNGGTLHSQRSQERYHSLLFHYQTIVMHIFHSVPFQTHFFCLLFLSIVFP